MVEITAADVQQVVEIFINHHAPVAWIQAVVEKGEARK
jgi:hypothetical protein